MNLFQYQSTDYQTTKKMAYPLSVTKQEIFFQQIKTYAATQHEAYF